MHTAFFLLLVYVEDSVVLRMFFSSHNLSNKIYLHLHKVTNNINTVKPVLRGQTLGQRKSGPLTQVTS